LSKSESHIHIIIGRLRRPLIFFVVVDKLRHFLIKVLLGHITCTRCGSILLKNVVCPRGTNFDRLGEVRPEEIYVIDGVHFRFFRCRWSECLSFPSNTHPRKPYLSLKIA
jgi:hypothetical protein